MAGAEVAYTKTMRTVSHVNLAGDCDGPAMRAALQRFSDLPYVLSEVTGLHCVTASRHCPGVDERLLQLLYCSGNGNACL